VNQQQWRSRALSRAALAASGAALLLGVTACGSGGSGGSGSTGGETGGEASESASSFPENDITFIVQAAAGGGSDLSSRALASEMEGLLDTSIVVENRPGASGTVAFEYVRDQEPDGYTIGFSPVEIAMVQHLGFDITPAEFDFLGQIMFSPGVIAVPSSSEIETLDDLIEASKERPLTVANSGAGSIWEAATLGLADETGADLQPVPFDGGAPAVAAALGAQVDAVVAGAGETVGAHNDGSLRVLALFNDEEHPLLEGVPTAESEGYDLMFGGWGGVYAPSGLPDDVRETLAAAVEEAAGSDGFADAITPSGALPTYKSPDEFVEFIDSESERFGTLLG
jgi:tripartite-type tricarboxylate transporter receptor subunit TctC